jgi:hypothetical protein
MKNIRLTIPVVITILLFAISACQKDLQVEYLNKPDKEKALSNPEDVKSIALSGFYNWWMTNNTSISPRMAMWVAADQGTCSWANSGMYHLSSEPRQIFNNSVTYTYANIFENYYSELYGTLSMMNAVLEVIDNGMEIGSAGSETQMVRASAYFVQGLTLGYLGLVYDKAFIMKEHSDYTTTSSSLYMDVVEAAVVSMDSVISICENNYFTMPSDWINGSSYTVGELKQLANSFAARFLVYAPRNVTDNDQIDWDRVWAYANNGIDRDLAPYMDDSNWKSYYRHYTVRPGWARIDSRIINLLDPNYPFRFPDSGQNPPVASSNDTRLNTDFSFNSNNNMKPERGYYHYSNYEYTRYPYAITTYTIEVPDFLVTENELIKAEALANMGDIAGAVQIINAGSRVTRGHLDALEDNISKEELLDALFYERDIELIQTGFGIAFFDMRRRDMLQTGTLLHFPIPGKELMVMQLPEYTFGGVSNADGINTSNGGWFPEK